MQAVACPSPPKHLTSQSDGVVYNGRWVVLQLCQYACWRAIGLDSRKLRNSFPGIEKKIKTWVSRVSLTCLDITTHWYFLWHALCAAASSFSLRFPYYFIFPKPSTASFCEVSVNGCVKYRWVKLIYLLFAWVKGLAKIDHSHVRCVKLVVHPNSCLGTQCLYILVICHLAVWYCLGSRGPIYKISYDNLTIILR